MNGQIGHIDNLTFGMIPIDLESTKKVSGYQKGSVSAALHHWGVCALLPLSCLPIIGVMESAGNIEHLPDTKRHH